MTLLYIAKGYWSLYEQCVDAGNVKLAERYLTRYEEVCEKILEKTRRELA
jgi:hypothetical protein